MKSIKMKSLFLSSLLALPLLATADIGDLDPTFGKGRGWVNFTSPGSYRNYEDIPVAIMQQTDGKLVIVGNDQYDWGQVEISRLTLSGSLDTSFNQTGQLVLPFSLLHYARDAVLLPNNKLLIAGVGTNTDYEAPVLLRLNQDGSLDKTFGDAGTVYLPQVGGTTHYAVGNIVVQPDGKYAIAEAIVDGWGDPLQSFIVRLNTNGTLDTSFDGDGISADTGFHSESSDAYMSMMMQADGKFLVQRANGPGNKIKVVRLNANGSLDNTFNGTGSYQTALTGYYHQMVQQGDGRLLLFAGAQGGENLTLLRLNTDGTLDTSFDGDGIRVEPFDGHPVVRLDASHNMNVVLMNYDSSADFVRYLPNGDRDMTFNGSVPVASDMWGLPAFLLQADGKWVVGAAVKNIDNNTYDYEIYRHNGNDAVDSGFGVSGVARINFRGYETNGAAAYTALQQQDGKLVTAGWLYDVDSTKQFGLVRYNLNGSLDTSFNGSGSVVTTMDERNSYGSWLRELIQQTDGKLVAAGYTQGGAALARYNADGSLDTSFNGSGKVVTDEVVATIGTFGHAVSVVQQSDGKLVAGGYTYSLVQSKYQLLLIRYNPDGSLDASFNGSGFATAVTGDYSQVNSVLQQSDGKLVAVGIDGEANCFLVARFLNDGSLDHSFNGQGTACTSISIYQSDAHKVIQQPDGKLVVAGTYGLVRYNGDGSLDATFGGDGVVESNELGYPRMVKYLRMQEEGKLLVVATDSSSIVFIRYNPDGSPDESFGAGGVIYITINPSLQTSELNAAFLQTDGKLVAAGVSSDMMAPTTSDSMMLARFSTVVKDVDKDGLRDSIDNCPKKKNADQSDIDGDGLGDVCDKDMDGDGIKNGKDKYPLDTAAW